MEATVWANGKRRKMHKHNCLSVNTHTNTHSLFYSQGIRNEEKKVFSEKFLVPVAIETIGSPDGDKRSKLQRWRLEP